MPKVATERRSKRAQPPLPTRPVRRTRQKATAPVLDKPKTVRKKAAAAKTYLHRLPSEAVTDPNSGSLLFRIPRQIFLEIANHLPPAGVACLTLTCKLALEVLGTDSWAEFCGRARLQHGPEDSLCNLLSRDLPSHEYCVRCETMHPPLRQPHAHRCTKYTRSCFGFESTIDTWPQTADGGYSLVWPHIQQSYEERAADLTTGPPLDLFAGDSTIQLGTVNYHLRSSARWIDRRLVLAQQYRLSPATASPLQAASVITMPLRICAHLTTSPALPTGEKRRWHAASARPNGPLLTHAIQTAFPAALRSKAVGPTTFRTPTDSEQTQMTTGAGDPEFIWRCRSCPTKFKVAYVPQKAGRKDGGELVVNAWYGFGKEIYRAVDYWKWFARRDLDTLSPAKRNSEFHAPTRQVPDFAIE
ncbi:hypothetical protein BJX64DRAFT_148326 [Aspergillus heterothallicus]